MAESYPRLSARTRRFSLGAPRDFTVSEDGARVAFLRSPAGDDPRTALWLYEDGEERLVASSEALDDPSAQERARRERARETAVGITSYAADERLTVAAYALSGELHVVDLGGGEVRRLEVPGPVFDPRPDPTGRHVAFVVGGALHVVGVDGAGHRVLAAEEGATWGLAEFAAGEEMGRAYGYRWAPDGDALLAARVDESPVAEWWIADAVDPGAAPRAIRYPACGTPNARVELHVVALDGERTRVAFDLEYLAAFGWDTHGPFAAVQSRDQRRLVTLAVDPGTGATEVLCEQTDDAWVELVPGAPARLDDGRLVTVDHEQLRVAGEAVAPGLHVRSVGHAGADVVFTASADDPTQTHVYRWDGDLHRLTHGPGVHGGHRVLVSRSLQRHGATHAYGDHVFASHALAPDFAPEPRLLVVGERDLRVAVLLPHGHDSGALPVLIDPYGGPHHQRVMQARGAFYEAQWLADQGFAIVIADGRGTPGRGRDFTTAVHGDLATAPLSDQVDALHAAAEHIPELDLSRVAIRGWSFGGFLAALAVLRRPDVFHAAIAGAPVVDWRLYDTHYTERYLGPEPDPRSSPIHDAAALERPLMIIHGLADDNVVAAHSLRLSRALTEAGRPHTFLPLTGVTHMTPQEEIAENLLLLQVDFLRRSLSSMETDSGSMAST